MQENRSDSRNLTIRKNFIQELYPGSILDFSTRRFDKTYDSGSNCTIFLFRILTGVCSLENLHNKNVGGKSRIDPNVKPKQKLDESIHDEIVKAFEFHYSKQVKNGKKRKPDGSYEVVNYKSEINKVLNNKLIKRPTRSL